MEIDDPQQRYAVRLAHLETEVAGLRSDFKEVKQAIARLFEQLGVVSQKGSPSWQSIIAFVFSGISALSIIGGGIGLVVGLFVRTETDSLRVQQDIQSKALDALVVTAAKSSEERASITARLGIVEHQVSDLRQAKP